MKKLVISLFITLLFLQNQAYAFSNEITDEAKEKIIYTQRNIYFMENSVKKIIKKKTKKQEHYVIYLNH